MTPSSSANLARKGKEGIRTHFNYMRQAFIDWNNIAMDDENFEKQKSKILNLIKKGENDTEDLR